MLAAKAKIPSLENWVKFESEGYPSDASIPDYRVVGITYYGTFSGPMGSGINNAPIPAYLIQKHVGEGWLTQKIFSSISEIESLVNSSKGSLQTSGASDLPLLLTGKVYPNYSCVEVIGKISSASMVAIQHAVRSRILSLTTDIDNEFPEIASIKISESFNSLNPEAKERAEVVTQKIVYGNSTEIHNSGNNNQFNLQISAGNYEHLQRELKNSGLNENDASEIAGIIKNEKPSGASEPLGKKAKQWLAKIATRTAVSGEQVGIGTIAGIVSAAATKYYGI